MKLSAHYQDKIEEGEISTHHDYTTKNQTQRENLEVPRDVEGCGAWGIYITKTGNSKTKK